MNATSKVVVRKDLYNLNALWIMVNLDKELFSHLEEKKQVNNHNCYKDKAAASGKDFELLSLTH